MPVSTSVPSAACSRFIEGSSSLARRLASGEKRNRRQCRFDCACASAPDFVTPRMRTRSHDASEGTADKMSRGAIIQRQSLRYFPARHETMESAPSFWFAIEMWTTGSRKQFKTSQTRQADCGRIRHTRPEPADGARADPGQHNPHAPGSSQQPRKIPLTPSPSFPASRASS
jgi:hypothetical protein